MTEILEIEFEDDDGQMTGSDSCPSEDNYDKDKLNTRIYKIPHRKFFAQKPISPLLEISPIKVRSKQILNHPKRVFLQRLPPKTERTEKSYRKHGLDKKKLGDLSLQLSPISNTTTQNTKTLQNTSNTTLTTLGKSKKGGRTLKEMLSDKRMKTKLFEKTEDYSGGKKGLNDNSDIKRVGSRKERALSIPFSNISPLKSQLKHKNHSPSASLSVQSHNQNLNLNTHGANDAFMISLFQKYMIATKDQKTNLHFNHIQRPSNSLFFYMFVSNFCA